MKNKKNKEISIIPEVRSTITSLHGLQSGGNLSPLFDFKDRIIRVKSESTTDAEDDVSTNSLSDNKSLVAPFCGPFRVVVDTDGVAAGPVAILLRSNKSSKAFSSESARSKSS